MNIDALHMLILEDLLKQFDIRGLSEADKGYLNRIWHRLDLWPDVETGLKRLRRYFVVAPLSNGNVALLTNLSKHAGISWDCILSSELARHYKPDPEVYLCAAELLGLQPEQIVMVAAHNGDLNAAGSLGFGTAFVYRPREHGPNQTTNLEPQPGIDIVARDFNDLADQLSRD
jgi:2-haloacid dehalogenase